MIVLIDNYDSFTYNLVQYFGELVDDIRVFRNDMITVEEIDALKPDHIVVSPGPCTPAEAGISIEVIEKLSDRYPIMGVCLGHQSIGAAFGGDIVRADRIMHGKISSIKHTDNPLFEGMTNPFNATRYHSLIIKRETCPDDLEIIAETEEGEIMAVAHKSRRVWGLQFHPESILTENGKAIIRNYIKLGEAL